MCTDSRISSGSGRADPSVVSALIARFRQALGDASSRAPDWAWDFKPSIPFVGNEFVPGRGILVYASAENLNYVNSKAAPKRFRTEAAWNRYRARLDEFGRPADAFFPDVGIQPVSNGGLLAAALFVAGREGYRTTEDPWSFLERLAVSNWCKFSIRADANKDYLGSKAKLAVSLPYVVSELAELRPSLAMIPKAILGHKALESKMKEASPETRFLPVPQFNSTVINCHLGNWEDRGREIAKQAAGQTLGQWMQRLDGVSKSNAWRYIAWLEERLSGQQGSQGA